MLQTTSRSTAEKHNKVHLPPKEDVKWTRGEIPAYPTTPTVWRHRDWWRRGLWSPRARLATGFGCEPYDALDREVLNRRHAHRDPTGGAGVRGQATGACLAVSSESCVEPIGEAVLTKCMSTIGETTIRNKSGIRQSEVVGAGGRLTCKVTTWCGCKLRNRWHRLARNCSTICSL